jgi:hypothetical protein
MALAGASWVMAQGADIGLVTQVKGEVTYTGQGGGAGKAQDYMRVREADRFVLPAGTSLRVVYLQSGRQETWSGPASLKLGGAAGELVSGKPPLVAQLPPTVPQRIARTPDMFQQAHMARLGGIAVRGGPARPRVLSPEDAASISAARDVYQQMRATQSGDDITAQLYFASVLSENLQFEEMKRIVDEMQVLQPGNADVQALGSWVADRLKRGH